MFNYPLKWIVKNCILAPVIPFKLFVATKEVDNVLPVAHIGHNPLVKNNAVSRQLNSGAAAAYQQLLHSGIGIISVSKTQSSKSQIAIAQSPQRLIDISAKTKVIRSNLVKQYQLLSTVSLNNHGDASINARNFVDFSNQWCITKCVNS